MRIPKTPKGRTNRLIAELEKNGIKTGEVQFGDGYFIFEHGKDMVVWLNIKGCRGWRFGIWWSKDLSTFDFFGQPVKDIDKFKPSASVFVLENIEFDLLDFEVGCRIAPMIKFIKRHRYVAWYYHAYWQTKIWDKYITSYRAWMCFVGYRLGERWYRIKEGLRERFRK